MPFLGLLISAINLILNISTPKLTSLYENCISRSGRSSTGRQDRHAAKKTKARRANAPQPLPSPRPHSLSILPQTPQPASLLLTRLPPEIRHEIYKYVVGGNLIHILRKGRHLAHVRCTRYDLADFDRSCRPYAACTVDDEVGAIASTANGNVALLRTCRVVYAEAVEIMYATNIFDFDHQDLFLLFARGVAPQRLGLVRQMHLSCRGVFLGLPCKFEDGAGLNGWESMWAVVARAMPGLRHLRMRVTGEQGLAYPDEDRWWVKSICQVRGLRSFHLEFRAPSNCWVVDGGGVFEKEKSLENYIRTVVCSESIDKMSYE
ncbi:MAG: hypothetical protein Q9205_001799 [Flavoplaca limonia]